MAALNNGQKISIQESNNRQKKCEYVRVPNACSDNHV